MLRGRSRTGVCRHGLLLGLGRLGGRGPRVATEGKDEGRKDEVSVEGLTRGIRTVTSIVHCPVPRCDRTCPSGSVGGSREWKSVGSVLKQTGGLGFPSLCCIVVRSPGSPRRSKFRGRDLRHEVRSHYGHLG